MDLVIAVSNALLREPICGERNKSTASADCCCFLLTRIPSCDVFVFRHSFSDSPHDLVKLGFLRRILDEQEVFVLHSRFGPGVEY